MNKKTKEVKTVSKVKAVEVRDLSLAGLLRSHIGDFQKERKASACLYNGSRKAPRWAGSITGGGVFTLSHYSTPILKIGLSDQKAELVKLPEARLAKGYSNGDLRGINTTLEVLKPKNAAKAIKRQGYTSFVSVSSL